MNDRYSLKEILIYLFIPVVIVFIVISCVQGIGRRNAVAGIGEPVQTVASGKTEMSVNGYKVDIQYKYEYMVEALVVHTKKYRGPGIGDRLSPMDAALAWGKVAEYNKTIDFHWSQHGRWFFWKLRSYDELAPIGGVQDVMMQAANNHLIPANKDIRKQIKRIRRGDHIVIRGYLVDVEAKHADGRTFSWHSSTRRDDSGGGSCELIYVTGVEWKS